jgi:hypothetical protein
LASIFSTRLTLLILLCLLAHLVKPEFFFFTLLDYVTEWTNQSHVQWSQQKEEEAHNGNHMFQEAYQWWVFLIEHRVYFF